MLRSYGLDGIKAILEPLNRNIKFYNCQEVEDDVAYAVEIIKEFADNGFENTSIQQIAKKAGISVGSIYKYFENKETIP